LPSSEQLPDDLAILKRMILELLETLRQERSDKEALRHRLDYLLRRLYGPRGERFDPKQPLLFEALADAAQAETTTDAASATTESVPAEPTKKPRPAPHGRRTLPANLPRHPQEHVLSEAERVCPGCGQARIDIGVDTSEQLEYQPASLCVIEHRVHKYVCPCCSVDTLATVANPGGDTPVSAVAPSDAPPTDAPPTDAPPTDAPPTDAPTTDAPAVVPMSATPTTPEPRTPPPDLSSLFIAGAKPPQPIAKGLPGPGLLAHLIVSKCVDHLPLHRLERIYERQGLVLPRSTTCDWLAACARVLRPLYAHMVDAVLHSRVIHTDDTTVKILDPPPGATRLGRLWVYLGDAQHPYNVFDFTPNRERVGPQRFLANFQGFLQADAYTGYDGLYLPHADGVARVFEVACNAHARRKFHDARAADAARSHQALAYYGQLYEIERRAKGLQADEALRRQMRQDLAVPILEQMEKWLKDQKDQVLPKSPMGEAIGYALNNWTALVRYTEHGFLAIDNNVAEREMKTIAIGRKNWLHLGSENGGHTAAVLFSFTSTCRRLNVEPWAYLKDVLTRLPTTPTEHLTDLLPDRWQAPRAAAAAAAAALPSSN
jgi:transposase